MVIGPARSPHATIRASSRAIPGAALMAITSACYVNVEEIGATLYALRILQSIAFAYAFAAIS